MTGGAGFIGSNLTKRLVDDDVVIVDNLHTGSLRNLEGAEVRFFPMDSRDVKCLRFDADLIFHLGVCSSSPMYQRNRALAGEAVEGMIQVLEYALSCGAKLVFASSSSVYNGHEPPHVESMVPKVTDYYAEARIAMERLAELYHELHGLEYAGLRFFSVYGPGEDSKGRYANLVSQFLWAMRAGQRPRVYGDGHQRRDFIYIEDVVDAVLAAARSKSSGVFNVGTGRSYSLNELVLKLSERLGVPADPEYVSMPVRNYVYVVQADTRKAERELGFRARYSLDDGLKEMMPK